MNRSIFQIWQSKLKGYVYSLLISAFIIFFVNFEIYINCFSIKGLNNNLLKEINYNGIILNCSEDLSESLVKSSFDKFLNNYNGYNTKFSICRYFNIINDKPTIFNKYSCYSHPNLFFGVYNHIYFNFQFSHKQVNNNFELFSRSDINGVIENQYINCRFNLYTDILFQQYLNYDDLKNNLYEPYINNHTTESQDFINLNKKNFTKHINNALKN